MNLGDLYSQFSSFFSEILPVLIFHIVILVLTRYIVGIVRLRSIRNWLFNSLTFQDNDGMINRLGLSKAKALIFAVLLLSYFVVFKKLSGYLTKFIPNTIISSADNETYLWEFQEEKSDLAIIEFFRTNKVIAQNQLKINLYDIIKVKNKKYEPIALDFVQFLKKTKELEKNKDTIACMLDEQLKKTLYFRERKLYQYRFEYPDLYRAQVQWALEKENLSGFSYGLIIIFFFSLAVVICCYNFYIVDENKYFYCKLAMFSAVFIFVLTDGWFFKILSPFCQSTLIFMTLILTNLVFIRIHNQHKKTFIIICLLIAPIVSAVFFYKLRDRYEYYVERCITQKNRFVATQLMFENNITSPEEFIINNKHKEIEIGLKNYYSEFKTTKNLLWLKEIELELCEQKQACN